MDLKPLGQISKWLRSSYLIFPYNSEHNSTVVRNTENIFNLIFHVYSRLNIHCVKQLTLCTILWYLYRYGKMKDLFYFNLLGDSFSLISYIWHRTYMKHQVLTSRLPDLNSLKYYYVCALQNLTLLVVFFFKYILLI